MSLNLLKESLLSSPIIKKDDYSYLVHPLLDGISQIEPALLSEVIDSFKKLIKPVLPVDRIVTIEAMGIPYASVLSVELQIPFTIIRKKSYGFSDEKKIIQNTGYATNNLYINGIEKGKSVILVDDVISTGSTLRGVLKQLQKMQVKIKGAFIIVDKGSFLKDIETKMNIPIKALATIKIENNQVLIVD